MTKLKEIKLNAIQTKKATNISALPPVELKKYKHLTGEDLRFKSGVVEKVKFGCFPQGKVFSHCQ